MATDPSIGTRIKRARERKRWTQRELADRLGVNIKTVDNYENNRTYPRSSIGALEEVLGISLNGTQAEPEETEWDRWERSVLTDDRLPADVAEAIVRGARAARDEAEAARGGSARTAPGGRHRAAG